MVVLQAVRTSGDGPSPTREGLVVQPGVRYRPVQVLTGQRLPPELAVVDDPPGTLLVPLRPHYGGLIGKELGCLFREAGRQDRRHQGVLLHPLRDACDR